MSICRAELSSRKVVESRLGVELSGIALRANKALGPTSNNTETRNSERKERRGRGRREGE